MYSISVHICTHNALVRRRKEQAADKNPTRARGPFLLLPRLLPERWRHRLARWQSAITCYLTYPLHPYPLSEHTVSNVDKYHQLNIEITPGARSHLARISAQQLVIVAARMGVLLWPRTHFSSTRHRQRIFLGPDWPVSISLKLLYRRLYMQPIVCRTLIDIIGDHLYINIIIHHHFLVGGGGEY